jgi:hypothetical protein
MSSQLLSYARIIIDLEFVPYDRWMMDNVNERRRIQNGKEGWCTTKNGLEERQAMLALSHYKHKQEK